MTITEYVNRDKIIKLLIKYRVNLAFSRHKDHLISEITKNQSFIDKLHFKGTFAGSNPEFDYITTILPPRRKWVKLNEKERVRFRDSFTRNIKSLELTFIKEEKSNDKADWFYRLEKFIKDLLDKFYLGTYNISKPQLLAILKEKKQGEYTYRPISKYCLEDRLVISLVAKYLTDCFDFVIRELNCAYAFRSTNNNQKITHHDCVKKIAEYLKERQDKDVFVVECDIKKFYDCINHEKLVEQFEYFVEKSTQKKITISPIAKDIFYNYLKSYSFKTEVYNKNSDKDWFSRNKLKYGKFKWEETGLRKAYYETEIPDYIGVAQGGALSCLISNIYMHYVDEKILGNDSFVGDKELLYVRFCDDMVILHSDFKRCQIAMDVYVRSIKYLKLLYHESTSTEFVKYDKTFWSEKSKPIYKFDFKNNKSQNCVPWLAFVGYQIRRDGLIRVRRASLVKEKKKIVNERMRVLKALGFYKRGVTYSSVVKNIKIPTKNIIYRLQNRYISMSVGKIELYGKRILENGKIIKTDKTLSQGLCWTNGFKLLEDNPIVARQLKDLDRYRNWNIQKLKRFLEHIRIVTGDELGAPNKKNDREIKIKYFGHPYSYHFYLKRGVKTQNSDISTPIEPNN